LTTPADVGDHVVVINTKHVAMVEDLWRKQQYKHDTRFVDIYISQYRRYSDIERKQRKQGNLQCKCKTQLSLLA